MPRARLTAPRLKSCEPVSLAQTFLPHATPFAEPVGEAPRAVLAGPDLLARRDRIRRARTAALRAAIAAHVVRTEHADRCGERAVGDPLGDRREARVVG